MHMAQDIRCWDAQDGQIISDHQVILICSYIFMFLYTFGIPIFIYVGLEYLHKRNKEFQPQDRAKYGYLYFKYKNKLWWWEPLVILPRKGIIGIIALFTSAEKLMLLQISLTLVIIIFYLMLHLQRKPFIEEFLNEMELYALGNHFFVLLLGCIFLSESFTHAPTALSVYAYLVIISILYTVFSLLKFTVKELSDEGIFTMLRVGLKNKLIESLAIVKGDQNRTHLQSTVDQNETDVQNKGEEEGRISSKYNAFLMSSHSNEDRPSFVLDSLDQKPSKISPTKIAPSNPRKEERPKTLNKKLALPKPKTNIKALSTNDRDTKA